MQPIKPTLCRSCEKPIKGRTDKKFCNDYCRNLFHNREKPGFSEATRRIDRILHKNRSLLNSFSLNSGDIIYLRKEYLIEIGFNFKYFTHIKHGARGSTYRYCYEFGYMETENGEVLLIGEETPIY